MPIRLNPTNLSAAAIAEAELPTACRALATQVTESVEALAALEAATDVQSCLDALIAHRRMGARVKRAEDRVLLLMNQAGASPTGLGNALGINQLTVSRRIEAAEAETD